jgi:hypothetical protein
MNHAYLKQRFADIDTILAQGKAIINSLVVASSTKTADIPTQHFLAGHAVVAICGIYEDCVEKMFAIRASKSGDAELERFMEETMDQMFRNPDYAKIKQFLRKLNPALIAALDKAVQHRHSSALDSIVTAKNDIAHGKPSTVTLQDVEDYHTRAALVFETIEKMIC